MQLSNQMYYFTQFLKKKAFLLYVSPA